MRPSVLPAVAGGKQKSFVCCRRPREGLWALVFSGGALVTGGWWPAFIFPKAAGVWLELALQWQAVRLDQDPRDVQEGRELESCVVGTMAGKGLPAGGSAEEAMR